MRTLDDLDRGELAILVREYLMAGHLIDRAGMPQVIPYGLDAMRAVAVDEWMGASPIYTKRMQRLLGFEGDTVETAFKGMQLDIGAPPEFLDFRYEVVDDHHGSFRLAHCGALMDVEPMGEDYVVTMCHHIEDPTFDATAWATNPRMRMRPLHRPPRTPADRTPHCEWVVTIDPAAAATAEPAVTARLRRSLAARLPLANYAAFGDGDGDTDYSGSLETDLRLGRFSTATLRAVLDEVALQGHLLVMSFMAAVGDRFGSQEAAAMGSRQGTGVAGVVARRLARAFDLRDGADDLATLFALHPAFHPRGYVGWSVTKDASGVVVELSPCVASREEGHDSWITLLAAGYDGLLAAVAAALDPRWSVSREATGGGDPLCRWRIEPGDGPAEEAVEVTITRFSGGADFGFTRPV